MLGWSSLEVINVLGITLATGDATSFAAISADMPVATNAGMPAAWADAIELMPARHIGIACVVAFRSTNASRRFANVWSLLGFGL